MPQTVQFPDLSFPKLQRGKLKNGIEVILAERHTIPVTQVELLFDAGYAADQGGKLGTASFSAALMNESTAALDSVEVAQRRQRLGRSPRSAAIWTAAALRWMRSTTSCNRRCSCSPTSCATRHSRPPTSNASAANGCPASPRKDPAQQPGTARVAAVAVRRQAPVRHPAHRQRHRAAIKSLNAQDLRQFHSQWLRPDNLRILVAGDTTLAQIIPQLDAVFGDWKAPTAALPKKNLANVAAQPKPRVYLINRPDAPQSVILAGLLAPSTKAPDNLAIGVANGAFGGTFTSRLNMNLRENKRWAYGAGTRMMDAQGQRPYLFSAPVQTDKTAESANEIFKEATAIIGDKPLTSDEIEKIKNQRIRALPGSFETTDAVLGAIEGIVQFDRPDDYVQTLKPHLGDRPDGRAKAIKEIIKPEAMTWVIVGDLKKIEAPVRALKLGEVQVLDVDGRPVKRRSR